MQVLWSETVWQQAQPVLAKIITQPFNQELMQGTLAQETFLHYIQQDTLYLKQFARSLGNILPKLESREQSAAFLGFLQDTMTVENGLHQQYLQQVEQQNTQMSPTCLMYTQFMLATTSMNSAAIGIASVLPCFWIYQYVGDHIYTHYQQEHNPYFEWIQTYAGEEYGQAVKSAIRFADELAANQSDSGRAQMSDAFLMACKMEYLFWDSAYRQEEWVI